MFVFRNSEASEASESRRMLPLTRPDVKSCRLCREPSKKLRIGCPETEMRRSFQSQKTSHNFLVEKECFKIEVQKFIGPFYIFLKLGNSRKFKFYRYKIYFLIS